MLSSLLFALSLEGLLPGLVAPRRPIPVVRYERAREPRARRHLWWLARRLLSADAIEPGPGSITDLRPPSRGSASTSTGAGTVLFLGG